jgi:hypothetical protein
MANRALKAVPEPEPEQGDPLERQAQMSKWTPGQVECRAEHQHRYRATRGLQVYGKKVTSPRDLPVGTRIHIVQLCGRCKSVGRKADHVVTRRGIRPLEDWKAIYTDDDGVEYLLRPGSGRLDDGDREELKWHLFLDHAKLKFVDE